MRVILDTQGKRNVKMNKKEIFYKNHKIVFHDLLDTGWNMDRWIREGTLFRRPDHNFDNILKLLKPNSVIYDIGSYIGTYASSVATTNDIVSSALLTQFPVQTIPLGTYRYLQLL